MVPPDRHPPRRPSPASGVHSPLNSPLSLAAYHRERFTGFPRADEMILATGEPVADALQHTRSGRLGGLFLIEVRRWRGGVAATVIDQGAPTNPHPCLWWNTAHGDGREQSVVSDCVP
jgi:hypothetical protein